MDLIHYVLISFRSRFSIACLAACSILFLRFVVESLVYSHVLDISYEVHYIHGIISFIFNRMYMPFDVCMNLLNFTQNWQSSKPRLSLYNRSSQVKLFLFKRLIDHKPELLHNSSDLVSLSFVADSATLICTNLDFPVWEGTRERISHFSSNLWRSA